MFAIAYPTYIREKAQSLRRDRKLTLDEIAERLAIPKTTVWYWIKDIEIQPDPRLVDTPRRAAARKRAVKSVTERHRALRDAAYAEGLLEFEEIAQRDPTFRDFVCMYIGEGYKKNRNRVAIANSDPRVVRLGDHWIRRFSRNPVKYSLQFHADQDLDYLIRFWSFGLGANPDDISALRKSNSGQLAGRNWRSKWGVLAVGANDTLLRARLQAWMDRVQGGWLHSPHGV